MRSIVLCAAVGLLGAGCSDESPIGPDPDVTSSSGNSMGGNGQGGASAQGLGYENGTRLVARNWVAEDGAKSFKAFYDSEIGTECFFNESADGLRCLPLGPTIQSTLFADAACTVPAAAQNTCAPAATHLWQPLDALCGLEGYRIFTAGPKLATAYQSFDGETCNEVSPSQNAYYAAEAEVPASAFVAAVVE